MLSLLYIVGLTLLIVVAVPLVLVRLTEAGGNLTIASESEPDRPISGLRFFSLGVLLFCMKYAADWLVAHFLFHHAWQPWDYFIPSDSFGVLRIPRALWPFYLSLFAMAVPFIWTGLGLTLRRLRTLRWTPWLALVFFVPLVNLIFFAMLAISRAGKLAPAPATQRTARDPLNPVARTMISVTVMVPITIFLLFTGGNILGNYGWGLFVGIPFAIGYVSVAIYNRRERKTLLLSEGIATLSVVLVGAAVFGFGMEGLVCLLMALPLILPLALAGGYLAWVVSHAGAPRATSPPAITACLLLLPGFMGLEHALDRRPSEFEVRSAVVIQASPERVWDHVIAFAELPPPTELLFRAGIAYPIRADIEGIGVGAVRYCRFSTGAFVEPIEVWDAPRLLRFGVSQQPESMRELSPFGEIKPRHLAADYFRATQGQFLLVPMPDGSTRLEGTTRYSLRYWPAQYWRLWSDEIVHRIHMRVLNHIKNVTESAP